MKHENYKYRLHYLLRQLSVVDYEIAMKWFPIRLNIHPKTWQRWIYLKESENPEIPSGAFYIIGLYFNIEPCEIFTNPLTRKDVMDSVIEYTQSTFSETTQREMIEKYEDLADDTKPPVTRRDTFTTPVII